jgi:hypothetical protein
MLEGLTTKSWWKWNETIGPLTDRPGVAGVWNYQLTTGLGLVEYMEWCDDMNLEPSKIPIPTPVYRFADRKPSRRRLVRSCTGR